VAAGFGVIGNDRSPWVNADINIASTKILQHLDMDIFAMRAEAQKGPFGIYGEVILIGYPTTHR